MTDTDLGTTQEIWVARGTYKPVKCVNNNCVCTSTCTPTSSLRASSFNLKNTVHIYGGFVGTESSLCQRPPDPDPFTVDPATDSVLSGDINGNDAAGPPPACNNVENTYNVVKANGTNRIDTVLDGFTITRGCDNAFGLESGGGGIRLNSGAAATIRNCNIIQNRASGGGGIYCPGSSTGSWIINSVIAGNHAGHGGGMGAKGGSPHVIVNTQIVGNVSQQDGGGIYLSEGTGNARITNCLLVRNQASVGGGGIILGGSSTILDMADTTVAYNSAGSGGGGILVVGSARTNIDNAIFWGNTASFNAQIDDFSSGDVVVQYSDVQGGYAGTGNINSNPLFVNTTGPAYDYSVQNGSPCIDAANNNLVADDETDLDRDGDSSEPVPLELAMNLRFVNDSTKTDTGIGTPPIVDMGAYEHCSTTTDCDDGDFCNGQETCSAGECRIAFTTDCDCDRVDDVCEPDCNDNDVADDCDPQPVAIALVSAVYECDDSLPRIRGNVLRLTFKCDVSPLPSPPSYPVEIRALDAQGGVGPNLAASFRYTLHPNNSVLRIGEENAQESPISIFSNTTWYSIIRSPTWVSVLPFEQTYVAVFGDADNTLLNDFADLSFIFGNLTGDALDQNRSDINADRLVDFADISDANGFNGSIAPIRPPGHTCTLPP